MCIGIRAIERGVKAPRVLIRYTGLPWPLICAVAVEAAKAHAATQPRRTNFLRFIAYRFLKIQTPGVRKLRHWKSYGTMLDGTTLAEAITRIDADVSPAPWHYMIGCLYPTHAQTALGALRVVRADLVSRVRGLKANASPLSPEELDKLNHLAATDVQTWARDELACAREFDLTILGGCCGTNEHYIETLAKEAEIKRRAERG